jgi:hypothetical protein
MDKVKGLEALEHSELPVWKKEMLVDYVVGLTPSEAELEKVFYTKEKEEEQQYLSARGWTLDEALTNPENLQEYMRWYREDKKYGKDHFAEVIVPALDARKQQQ